VERRLAQFREFREEMAGLILEGAAVCLWKHSWNREQLAQGCRWGGLGRVQEAGRPLGQEIRSTLYRANRLAREQFRAVGHEKDSRELAVHFFSAFQGMAAVALGANDREVVVMEAKRLKDGSGPCDTQSSSNQGGSAHEEA